MHERFPESIFFAYNVSEGHFQPDVQLVQAISQGLLQNIVGALPGAVPGTDKFQTGCADILRDRANLGVGFVEQMKASNVAIDVLAGESLPDLPDDVHDPAVRAAVDDQEPPLGLQHQTLLVGKIVRPPALRCAAVHPLPFADGRQPPRGFPICNKPGVLCPIRYAPSESR